MKKGLKNPGLVFLLLFLWGCALRTPKEGTAELEKVRYVQFGSRLFVAGASGKALPFRGARRVEKVPGGWLVDPEGECVSIFREKASQICLKPVPRIYPHLEILRVDSYALDLKILSLFPEVALFIWEKGRKPDLRTPLVISPGTHSLRQLRPGKTYLLSGAIILGPDLYGPLSRPLEIEVKDLEPPCPPSGGGYYIKGHTVILVWNPSPSRDVVAYTVERKGKVFEVRENIFKEERGDLKGEVFYDIRAVDGVGHKSSPLRIRVIFPEKEE